MSKRAFRLAQEKAALFWSHKWLGRAHCGVTFTQVMGLTIDLPKAERHSIARVIRMDDALHT